MKKLSRDKFMTEDEARRLLQAARTRYSTYNKRPHKHAPRDYALLALALNTGFREIELVGVRVADLISLGSTSRSESQAMVRVRRAKKLEVTFDEVAIPETARSAVVEYLRSLPAEKKEPHSRLFPLTTRQVRNIFKFYAKAAGLNPKLSGHSMRHTRGTLLYAKFKDITLVKEALGHADLKHSMIYMHTVDGSSRMASFDIGGEPEEKKS